MFKTKILKIDSSKAKVYYNEEKTSFQFQLEQAISVTSAESIVYSLVSAYIPFSFYSVNFHNNMLDVEENIGSNTTTRSIEIPQGNYSSIEYARTIMGLLNTATIKYDISYHKISNTFSIRTVLPNTSAIFKFDSGPNAKRSCHIFLGLPDADTIINNEPFQTGLITMNDIYYLQIRTDIGSSDNIITSDGSDGLLDIIPVADQPLNFISYNPINPSKFLLQSNTLYAVNIGLTDNKGRSVDLNGIPFLLTIRIDVIDSAEHNIAVAQGREELDGNPQKTNLEMFIENPALINPPQHLNLSDLREYQLIKDMLSKVKKNKRKKSS